MFSCKRQNETCIPVSLDEPLTSDSCTKLIMELIKYILYQKQQVPFSIDTLVQLQQRFKPTDRNFGSTKTVLSSLRSISDNLISQLHVGSCDIKEVVIIIGATTVSPKLCIRLELPSRILSSQRHMEYQHSSRKPLLNLMRAIIQCEEFQQAMNVPLGVTNTFVLLQKSDSNPISEFFLPKPQYAPPTLQATSFAIKFSDGSDMKINCECSNAIKVYNDLSHGASEENVDSSQFDDYIRKNKSDSPYLWYQSREVIKGFKFSR